MNNYFLFNCIIGLTLNSVAYCIIINDLKKKKNGILKYYKYTYRYIGEVFKNYNLISNLYDIIIYRLVNSIFGSCNLLVYTMYK